MVNHKLNNLDDIAAKTIEEIEEEELLHNNSDITNSTVKQKFWQKQSWRTNLIIKKMVIK